MFEIESSITGKTAKFGEIQPLLAQEGFELGSNWDYHGGFFDSLLTHSEDEPAESYYVRIPITVLEGHLDQPDAIIQFGVPFVIKHVVQTGADETSENPIANSMGLGSILNQFQTPIDTDGYIENKDKWAERARIALKRVEKYV